MHLFQVLRNIVGSVNANCLKKLKNVKLNTNVFYFILNKL